MKFYNFSFYYLKFNKNGKTLLDLLSNGGIFTNMDENEPETDKEHLWRYNISLKALTEK